MRVKVGLINSGVQTADGKFIADTVTLVLCADDLEVQNMHKGNWKAVALAIARRQLDCPVFPVDIEEPNWPLLTAKEYHDLNAAKEAAAKARKEV